MSDHETTISDDTLSDISESSQEDMDGVHAGMVRGAWGSPGGEGDSMQEDSDDEEGSGLPQVLQDLLIRMIGESIVSRTCRKKTRTKNPNDWDIIRLEDTRSPESLRDCCCCICTDEEMETFPACLRCKAVLCIECIESLSEKSKGESKCPLCMLSNDVVLNIHLHFDVATTTGPREYCTFLERFYVDTRDIFTKSLMSCELVDGVPTYFHQKHMVFFNMSLGEPAGMFSHHLELQGSRMIASKEVLGVIDVADRPIEGRSVFIHTKSVEDGSPRIPGIVFTKKGDDDPWVPRFPLSYVNHLGGVVRNCMSRVVIDGFEAPVAAAQPLSDLIHVMCREDIPFEGSRDTIYSIDCRKLMEPGRYAFLRGLKRFEVDRRLQHVDPIHMTVTSGGDYVLADLAGDLHWVGGATRAGGSAEVLHISLRKIMETVFGEISQVCVVSMDSNSREEILVGCIYQIPSDDNERTENRSTLMILDRDFQPVYCSPNLKILSDTYPLVAGFIDDRQLYVIFAGKGMAHLRIEMSTPPAGPSTSRLPNPLPSSVVHHYTIHIFALDLEDGDMVVGRETGVHCGSPLVEAEQDHLVFVVSKENSVHATPTRFMTLTLASFFDRGYTRISVSETIEECTKRDLQFHERDTYVRVTRDDLEGRLIEATKEYGWTINKHHLTPSVISGLD